MDGGSRGLCDDSQGLRTCLCLEQGLLNDTDQLTDPGHSASAQTRDHVGLGAVGAPSALPRQPGR